MEGLVKIVGGVDDQKVHETRRQVGECVEEVLAYGSAYERRRRDGAIEPHEPLGKLDVFRVIESDRTVSWGSTFLVHGTLIVAGPVGRSRGAPPTLGRSVSCLRTWLVPRRHVLPEHHASPREPTHAGPTLLAVTSSHVARCDHRCRPTSLSAPIRHPVCIPMRRTRRTRRRESPDPLGLSRLPGAEGPRGCSTGLRPENSGTPARCLCHELSPTTDFRRPQTLADPRTSPPLSHARPRTD